jgi:glycosyltransferase involved in cell wall biosynthesis
MSPRPTVSVVIPYHNEGDLLTRALDSVCAQTFTGDLEIIVVDDASRLPPPVHGHYRWPVKVVPTPKNVKLPAARNWGVKHAQADILCFLDADDEYLPERVKSHVDFLGQHPEVIMVGGPHYVVRQDVWLHIPRAVSEVYRPAPLGPRYMLPTEPLILPDRVRLETCMSYFLHAGMMTVRRDAFERVNGFAEDLRWGEDWEFGARIAQKGKIGFVPTPGMRYLCRSGSMTTTLNPEKEVSAAKIFRSWRETIPELPFRYRRILRGWERNSLLLAAQSYWEVQHRAPLALHHAWRALLCSPSVWAFRSVIRMALHTLLSGPSRWLKKTASVAEGPPSPDRRTTTTMA